MHEWKRWYDIRAVRQNRSSMYANHERSLHNRILDNECHLFCARHDDGGNEHGGGCHDDSWWNYLKHKQSGRWLEYIMIGRRAIWNYCWLHLSPLTHLGDGIHSGIFAKSCDLSISCFNLNTTFNFLLSH